MLSYLFSNLEKICPTGMPRPYTILSLDYYYGSKYGESKIESDFSILEQRLTEVNHPDHTLITYPDLGHTFAISPQWSTGLGPVEQNVLSDLHTWLSDRTHGLLEVLSDNYSKRTQNNT